MLFRYILKEHLRIFMVILFIGIAIYLFSTFFERVDDFSEAGVGFGIVVKYLVFTVPEVISLLLPAVFFLATIITLCAMAKNKELQALQAGGLTPFRLLKYLLIIAVFWGVVQLFVSQNLTTTTKAIVDEIWDIDVRKRQPKNQAINNVWFADENWIVYVDYLHKEGNGKNAIAYRMNDDGSSVEEIISAKDIQVVNHEWFLSEVVLSFPHKYEKKNVEKYVFPFKRDHNVLFLTEDESTNPEDLPVQYLYYALQELVEAGSNVEALKTAIHVKIAYSSSLLVLTLVAFALLSWKENVYICVSVGIFIVFIFYVFVMIGETLGGTGALSPATAAWFPHVTLSVVSLYRLIKVNYSKG